MENRKTPRDGEQTEAALPTTFVSSEESAELAQVFELEIDQARLVAGGLASAVRCCACHCCSCHC